MKRRRRIPYSAAELAFIRARRTTPRDLHAAFVRKFGRRDVNVDHIRTLCDRKGWASGRVQRWTRSEDALLRQRYPDTPTDQIARRLGRTVGKVYQRAARLGLKKTAQYRMRWLQECGARLHQSGKSHRFPKGHMPANKGLRRPGYGPGRMKETQFKKGVATNWKPVGSERLVDGYRYTKVSDIRNVPWTRNWKATHILLWERHRGPLPPSHALRFKNRDRTDVRLDNLELITRRENMARNSVHNLPKPLAQAVQLLGALKRKINRRSRRDEEQDRRSA